MINDLASRAATPPPNQSVRLFRRLVTLDLLTSVLTVFFSYTIALFYVTSRTDSPFTDIFGAEISSQHLQMYLDRFTLYFCALSILHTTVEWWLGKFSQRRLFDRYNTAYGAAASGVILMIIVWFVSWLVLSQGHMRGFFATMAFAYIPVALLIQAIINAIIERLLAKGVFKKSVALLIGNGSLADHAWELSQHGNLGSYTIVKRVAPPKRDDDIRAWLAERFEENPEISSVFMFAPSLNREATMEIVVESAIAGKSCKTPALTCGPQSIIGADWLNGTKLSHFNSPVEAKISDTAREIAARILAVFAVIPACLIHFVIAAAIRIDSVGDVIFKQCRYGLLGKEFTMFKYRTMLQDADSKKDSLRHLNENDGGLFKIKRDPRVTKTGRWLRKSSLDEIPQLINILRGEMLFVGPRPLPCRDLAGYDNRWQYARFLSKPGITGVWQISGRANIKFDEMCELDIWYSLNRSFRLDTLIIVKTIGAVAFGVGAH